jgi:hypothetical protein
LASVSGQLFRGGLAGDLAEDQGSPPPRFPTNTERALSGERVEELRDALAALDESGNVADVMQPGRSGQT